MLKRLLGHSLSETTPSNMCEVRHSIIEGFGLFSTADVGRGHVFTEYDGAIVDCQDIKQQGRCRSHIARCPGTDIGIDGLGVSMACQSKHVATPRTGLGAMVNSCEGTGRQQNAQLKWTARVETGELVRQCFVVAMCDIAAGEEILLKYRVFD